MNLLETLIAVAITAVMFTLASVAFMPALDSAKVTATKAEMQSMQAATVLFHIRHNRYPTTLRELCRGGVMKNCDNVDVWGNQYEINGREFRSAGPDGRMGNRDDIVTEL